MLASVTFAPEDSKGLGPLPLGFFVSSVPMWAAFPHPLPRVRIPAASDYYAPSDFLGGLWDFVRVAPGLLPTSLDIPPRISRVHGIGLIAECFRWRVSHCPVRSLRLPSHYA